MFDSSMQQQLQQAESDKPTIQSKHNAEITDVQYNFFGT